MLKVIKCLNLLLLLLASEVHSMKKNISAEGLVNKYSSMTSEL